MDALDDMFIIVQHNYCKIFICMQFVDNKILRKQHIFTTLCFQSWKYILKCQYFKFVSADTLKKKYLSLRLSWSYTVQWRLNTLFMVNWGLRIKTVFTKCANKLKGSTLYVDFKSSSNNPACEKNTGKINRWYIMASSGKVKNIMFTELTN